ncbi:hypothetical protein ACGTRS_25710 [Burkholderia semiarida]|uniref:Uncharacterized protein n=1 Tax=Burkholderia semiarida TaxID=2843303 RepID=A0ABW7L9M1_9BURK
MLTQQEWVARCAKRYVDRGGCAEQIAREAAQAAFDNRDGDESPEEAADTDMSYWTH